MNNVCSLLFQGPNFGDELVMAVLAIFFMGTMVLSAGIWLWLIAELGITAFERLHGRIMRLSV